MDAKLTHVIEFVGDMDRAVVSSAMRLCGILSNTSRMAFGVVLSRCSNSTLPASSTTQYQLERSPKSNPIVSFCPHKLFVCFPAVVLTTAGLLYLLCFKARR